MAGKVPVTNLSPVVQKVGPVWLSPGQTLDVPVQNAWNLTQSDTFSINWSEAPDDIFREHLKDGRLEGITFVTPLSVFDGYGQYGVQVTEELLKRGIEIDLYPVHNIEYQGLPKDVAKATVLPKKHWSLAYLRGHPEDVCGIIPARQSVVHTMWEADPIPKEWLTYLNSCPLVIVPNKSQVKLFKSSGVTVPMDYVPEPIDIPFWSNRVSEPDPNGPFTFIAWSRMTSRKMPAQTVAAFLKAFPRERYPKVRLIMKTIHGQFGAGQHQIPVIADDRVKIINQPWDLETLRFNVGKCHCGIFLSHGEGMYHPPMQAMALGVPVIVPNHSGSSDYADERWNFPIQLDPENPMIESPLGRYQNWWNPDLGHAIHLMKYVYDNYEEAQARAKKAKVMVKRYSTEKVVDRLVDILSKVK